MSWDIDGSDYYVTPPVPGTNRDQGETEAAKYDKILGFMSAVVEKVNDYLTHKVTKTGAHGIPDPTTIATTPISTTQLGDKQVTAAKMADATITTAQLGAKQVTAAKIADTTVTAAQIAPTTVTAAQIAANTITAGQIAPTTITAAQLAAKTVTAAQIADTTITAAQIAATTITDAKLAGGITTAKLGAASPAPGLGMYLDGAGSWTTLPSGSGGGGYVPTLYTHFVKKEGANFVARNSAGTSILSSTSAAAAIQAAIDDAYLNRVLTPAEGVNAYLGAGSVYIYGGDYPITTGITGKPFVSIFGDPGFGYDEWTNAGVFGTRLISTSTLGTAAVLTLGTMGTTSRVVLNPHGVTVANLVIDNYQVSTNVWGASVAGIDVVDSSFVKLHDLYLRNFTYNIRQRGHAGPGNNNSSSGTFDLNLWNITSKGGTYGFYQDSTGGAGTDGQISACRFMSAGTANIYLSAGGWQLNNIHFTRGSAGTQLNINGADQANVSNCYFDSGSGAGEGLVTVKMGGQAVFENCTFVHDTAGAYGIYCVWNKLQLQNCYQRAASSTANPSAFVYFAENGPVKGIVRGNYTRYLGSSNNFGTFACVKRNGFTPTDYQGYTQDDQGCIIADNKLVVE